MIEPDGTKRKPDLTTRIVRAAAGAALIVLPFVAGCEQDSATPATPRQPAAPSAAPPPEAVPDAPGSVVAVEGVTVTEDGRLLVELTPDAMAPGNPFDLDGKTLTFTPNGSGAYSRSVGPVVWEEPIGDAVGDGAAVAFEGFRFEFGGRRWDSFYLSRRGRLTFGAPPADSYADYQRYGTMRELSAKLFDPPTISPLYKPLAVSRGPYVSHRPDRVVVTWLAGEPEFYEDGVPPESPSPFQAVLGADGSVRFNYRGVTFGDGVTGLFTVAEAASGRLVAAVRDGPNPALPGHLDLLEVAIYETGSPERVIVEFTVREAIPEPPADSWISYDLAFDTDEPHWRHWSLSEEDLRWWIRVDPGGATAGGGGLLPRNDSRRISLLADVAAISGISTSVVASTSLFDNARWAGGDSTSPQPLRFSRQATTPVDLSQTDDRATDGHREVFRYRSAPDPAAIACGVVETLGDDFDLFVFHSEFRIDLQERLSHWEAYRNTPAVRGLGIEEYKDAPCGEGRLKGHWKLPGWVKGGNVWMESLVDTDRPAGPFDLGLWHFAHEFAHTWLAYPGYDRNGERGELTVKSHWNRELHAPAAFVWREGARGPRSLMGGSYWADNADGTFTRENYYGGSGGGFSWLDLYLMGLAEAHEVPDTFVLRNQRPVGPSQVAAEKEIVSIARVIAAEGPRDPPASASQKEFNAGFVYLLDPGQEPTPHLLDRHRRFRDAALEHWAHITGRRSRITTEVPARSAAASFRRSPASVEPGRAGQPPSPPPR